MTKGLGLVVLGSVVFFAAGTIVTYLPLNLLLVIAGGCLAGWGFSLVEEELRK
jgi:uncharacterized membrane protein